MTCIDDNPKNEFNPPSPGEMQEREKILLAIVEPMNWENGDFTSSAFQTKRLQAREQSVARQWYSSPRRLDRFVLKELLKKREGKPDRVLKGMISISAARLCMSPKVGEPCELIVLPAPLWIDGRPDYAHAHFGFSDYVLDNRTGTAKNKKQAAVSNLKDKLKEHGTTSVAACFLPFPLLYFTAPQIRLTFWRTRLWLKRRQEPDPQAPTGSAEES